MAVKVSSTIKLNEAKLKELTRQQYISLAQTADALITDIRDEQLMPFDTGNLQNDSTFLDDSQKQSVSLSGKAFFIGDIAPDIRTIKGGTLIHNDVEYDIHAGSKALNFDGSVNYTVLELI